MPTTPLVTDFTTLVNGLHSLPEIPAARHLPETDAGHWRSAVGYSDTQLIQAALAGVANTLDKVALGLQDIDSLRQRVQDERAKMESLQARYRSLLAPIRRLPMEVLQEVFIHSRRTEYGHYSKPPVVSQVSRHWRNVALSTPRLWSTIVVHLDAIKMSECVERLHLWVKRSAACSLSLVVQHRPPESSAVISQDDILQSIPPFAHAVAAYSHRLGLFAVKLHPVEARAMMDTWNTSDSKLAFPALQVFKTATPELDSGDACQKLHQFIYSKAPNLHVLDCANDSFSGSINLPWLTIKSFSGGLSPQTIRACFSSSGPLEVLETTVRDNWPAFPRTTCPPIATLTSLHLTLSLFTVTSVSFPPLPALQHLVLVNTCFGWDVDAGLILLLLVKWGKQLRYLCLPSGLSGRFFSCLHLTPNLEAFRIRRLKNIDDRTIKRLRSLNQLEIDVSVFNPDVTAAICNLISQLTLRTLTIIVEDDLDLTRKADSEFRERMTTLVPSRRVHILQANSTYPRFDTPYFTQKGGVFDEVVPFEGSNEDVEVSSSVDLDSDSEF